jgi:small subunit ribosomal protein S4
MERKTGTGSGPEQKSKRPAKKTSEYGRQLSEKQKVKEAYGVREKQFKRFFGIAVRSVGAPGENLLSLLERRLDNVVYRLKMSSSREQARQMVAHGHVLVNGKRVSSPSYLIELNDSVALSPAVLKSEAFVEQVVEKRMKTGIKVPEWLELDRKERLGKVLRHPVRSDIQMPVEEHLIVELYSR